MSAAPAAAVAAGLGRLSTPQLFVMAVFIWGTTWHAIVHQIALKSPEYGVTLRFALAALLVLGWARWVAREASVGGWRLHAVLAAQGAFMYSLSYLAVYHAERHVPSGLVAVGYSASPLLAGLGAWLMWRHPVGPRFALGGLLGVAGVALIFWPELAASGARPTADLGLVFTALAVGLSAVGALISLASGARGLPFWGAMGWSMLYGAGLSGAVWLAQTLTRGEALVPALLPPTTLAWWMSLAWLSVAGSVLAFGAFLTLQQRIGAGRAATIGVMTPVVALVVSALFESYRPSVLTAAGVALALWGNRWMLKRDGAPAKG
jgi:drug/metabolite transporter (DMT)-like permease